LRTKEANGENFKKKKKNIQEIKITNQTLNYCDAVCFGG
jgi:hypothetical protein